LALSQQLGKENAMARGSRFFALCTVCVLAAAQSGLGAEAPAPDHLFTARDQAFGVAIKALVFSPDTAGAQAATAAAFAEVRRIEGLWSASRKDSELLHINLSAGGDATVVSADTFDALSRGQLWSTATHRAFSLTAAPVVSLWHFSPGANAPPALPDKELLASRLALADEQGLVLDAARHTARLVRPGMAISLDPIAKGYAAECALNVLKTHGLGDALIALGGTIRARGSKGDKSWRVGIQDPRGEGYFAVVPIKDEAAATVGDYERYFELDSVRYSDRIDPHTGMPAHGLRSVTVLASDALAAEALSSAVLVMGAKEGMAFVEAQTGVQTVMVDAQNQVLISTGLKDRIKILRPPTP
jgi:thiamine biosynthesis lipoprotein